MIGSRSLIDPRSDRFQEPFFRYAGRLFLVGLCAACILPFYYMVMLAIHNNQDVVLHPLGILLPIGKLSLLPFRTVLSSSSAGGQGFVPFIENSLLLAALTVAGTIIVAVPGAYALARYVFPGSRLISGAFLVVYLFPSILLAIPLYVFFTKAHLLGALPPVAIVYIAQTLPVAAYMLREYFDTVPVSVEEAARMDGCSRWQTIRYVTLPLSVPALVSVGVYVFMIAWNEYLFALLFLVARPEHWTVSLGLAELSSDITVAPPVLMAGSVILTVPIILLFFAVERFLRGGLVLGAEKG
jgi:multiple sugar transport system permease protein